MSRSMVGRLCDVIRGSHVMGAKPFGEYHDARKARDASKNLKHRTPEDRLRGLKKALKNYRVTARLDDTRIVVRNDETGQEISL